MNEWLESNEEEEGGIIHLLERIRPPLTNHHR